MTRSSATLVLCVAVAMPTYAQNPATELWPELDVYWQPARHQRSFLELSDKTEREGPTHQASAGIYQDYTDLPRFYLRGGYRFTFSVRDASYRESRIVAEGTLTAYSAPLVRALNRTRVEFRFINNVYSYRVRDRVQLQRMSQASTGLRPSPYATFEGLYDSRYHTIARVEGRLGTEAKLGGPASVDVFLGRQNNSRSKPRYVNAIGVTMRVSY